MQIITDVDILPKTSVAASIGMFDGVHRGHRWLIESLRRFAAQRGLKSAVITFRNHPQNILRPNDGLKLIMPLDARLEMLASTGIDFVILMDFTAALSQLDSTGFIRLMSEHYGVGAMLVGFNHRFGHNRNEQYADYVRNGAALGVEFERAMEYDGAEAPVSSSIIRRLLDSGDVAVAAQKLGREFRLTGRVVHGFARGREIGFPTANIDVDSRIIVPQSGVYAVRVRLADGSVHGGMANIGVRPTFDDGNARSIEVNIFDFAGDIYDTAIDVDFVSHLREERAMQSVDDLRSQLSADLVAAHNALL